MMNSFKSKLSILKNNQTLSANFIMIAGMNLYNFGQFIYHFLSGRFLGKAQYGDLAAMISILGIITIVQLAFSLTVVRFIASEKNPNTISDFIKWVNKLTIYVAAITSVMILLLSPFLSKFLNLSQPTALYLLAPALFFSITGTIGRSILQGLLKFNHFVISLFVELIFKMLTIALMFFWGYTVFGAMFALLIALIASFVFNIFSLKDYLIGSIKKRPELKPLLKYSFFVLLQGLALTSMYSVDLLLVKHFFEADEAGIYASLAVLGRIVFFGSSPISNVMFPIVAKKHKAGESYYKIFYFSLILVALISLVISLFYYMFPKFAIGLLFGPVFLEGAGLLWWFAVFMMLLAIAMLVTQFYLSIGKTKSVFLFVAASILQIVLIWFFHNDLLTVIRVSIISAALLDVSLFVYFLYQRLKND